METKHDILVIDDEQVILDAVKKICGADGYSVDISLDAETALDKLSHNKYSLIICDIMLPEMNGFAFLEKLKEKKLDIPVIMSTGYSTVENAVKSLYTGAIDYIPKPFMADEISSAVTRGFRYAKILDEVKNADKGTIVYVPCPAKYYRLGTMGWVSVDDDGSVLIGITDLFSKIIDTIKSLNLSNPDEEIYQGTKCLEISAGNEEIHYFLSPMSGRIIERNEKLINKPETVEKDPYFEGWVYRIIPADLDYEIKHLTPCSSDRL